MSIQIKKQNSNILFKFGNYFAEISYNTAFVFAIKKNNVPLENFLLGLHNFVKKISENYHQDEDRAIYGRPTLISRIYILEGNTESLSEYFRDITEQRGQFETSRKDLR